VARAVLAALALALAATLIPTHALAQAPTPIPPNAAVATSTPTPTALATPTANPTPMIYPTPTIITTDPTAIELDPPMAFVVVLALLALAALALWKLFDFFSASRDDYYDTVREFARKGVFFSPILVSATAPVSEVKAAAAKAKGEAVTPERFELTGPGIMTTTEKAKFTATVDGQPAPTTMWRVDKPVGEGLEDAAPTLSASQADAVEVVASKRGAFVLIATLPGTAGAPDLEVRTQVTVAEPAKAAEDVPPLPFIGQGYGSLVGAVILIAALVVLAATRAIDADVVGVILGALAGYLFGVGVNQRN
jgi:hypothetical protein